MMHGYTNMHDAWYTNMNDAWYTNMHDAWYTEKIGMMKLTQLTTTCLPLN